MDQEWAAHRENAMHAVTRIAVVDDHPLYRAGIRQAVDAAFDMQVVAEGADAMDALHIAATSGSLAIRGAVMARGARWSPRPALLPPSRPRSATPEQ